MTAIAAGRAMREALVEAGERRLLIDETGRSRTGAALLDRVERLAGALLDRGLAHRPVGLFFWNSLAALEAYLAVEWIGGTRVPVDPGAAPEEARGVFAAAGVAGVLCDPAHAGAVEAPIVHDDDTELPGPPVWPGFTVESGRALLLYPRAVVEGRLMGVPISYEGWDATLDINVRLYRSGGYGPPVKADDCFLTAQQVMHGTAMLGTFPFLRMGMPQVLARRFEPDALLELIAREGVTSSALVSAMVARLAETAERRPGIAPALRRILYGGGVLPAPELRRALRVLGPGLVQLYGRLEGGWPLSVLGAAEHRAIADGDETLAQSCGRPISDTEIRLRPVPGRPAGEGELCVRNRMISESYADADGWCSLGDVMRQDERGYLFFRGRLDRMINTGYHVYPDEIEAAIREAPGIADTRVVGEPRSSGGETLVAYLVPAPNADASALPERVRESLERRLARYKVPREWRVVERLPS